MNHYIPEVEEAEDKNNYFDEKYSNIIYLNISHKENEYTAISTMPNNIKKLFFNVVSSKVIRNDPYSIFTKSNYKNSYKEQIRYKDGSYQSTESVPIEWYQADDTKINQIYDSGFTTTGWIENKFTNPEKLGFWFDFLDAPETDIGRMGAKYIMNRSKAVNDNNTKAIYYRENLNLFYLLNENEDVGYENDNYNPEEKNFISKENPENKYINTRKQTSEEHINSKFKESIAEQNRLIPYIESSYSRYKYPKNYYAKLFQIANTGKSCKEVLDELLYNYTYATQTITINAIPVYHLRPGNIVYLNDTQSMIEGQYIINSLSFPLSYNGTMSINATKLVSKLY